MIGIVKIQVSQSRLFKDQALKWLLISFNWKRKTNNWKELWATKIIIIAAIWNRQAVDLKSYSVITVLKIQMVLPKISRVLNRWKICSKVSKYWCKRLKIQRKRRINNRVNTNQINLRLFQIKITNSYNRLNRSRDMKIL